jgi:hypothetical protein
MQEIRADFLVIDARHAAANYAPLFRELCNQPTYAGLPILVVGAGVAESAASEDRPARTTRWSSEPMTARFPTRCWTAFGSASKD